ncbi:hypothetical protein BH23GEM6_BH23GEM6_27370 [soil metagenome]
MNRFKFFPIIAVSIFAAACSQGAPTAPAQMTAVEALTSRSAHNCENVRGEAGGNAFVPGGLTFSGFGSGTAQILGLMPKGSGGRGAIHLLTMHYINTSQGTIFTTDRGLLSPVDPPRYLLNNRYEIVGGTGIYEEASGFLHINAMVSLAVGSVDGTYHGRICT